MEGTVQFNEDLWQFISRSTGVYIVHFDHKKDACLMCLPRYDTFLSDFLFPILNFFPNIFILLYSPSSKDNSILNNIYPCQYT